MLDVATFEEDVQRLADERLLDVIEGMIDRMLNITPEGDVDKCSYAAYLKPYVDAKMMIRKLGFQMEFYWEDERPFGRYSVMEDGYISVPELDRYGKPKGSFVIAKQNPAANFAQRIKDMMPRMEEAHTKMYANPCKTCTVCQTRRKKWPTPITLPS